MFVLNNYFCLHYNNFPRGNKQAENNHIDKFQLFRKFEVIELKKGGKFNGKSEKNH